MLDQETAGSAQDTIYLCNFRVSVDGEWLCLKELQDVDYAMADSMQRSPSPPLDIIPIARDPVIIERSNLVNISKLIVKELIETSLKYGRMLDSDHMPLQHFFIVLEHVLRHGLRPKKGLLGPKKELWDILQLVEKTAMGRARAWLRMALMQKKLADYLKVLIDHKDDLLAEYFEPDALMMSDEAIVIMGLLVGLNVIDCNFVLSATVQNLQAKVESLTTTNALMIEDLSISKNNLLSLHYENQQLKKELGIEIKENEVSMKSEMEVAMKLLEKDIHDKQDTIVSLRRQLDDIKQINLEMYKKLQECENSLKHKTELISKLEAKTYSMTDIIQRMDEKYKAIEDVRSGQEERVRVLGAEAAEKEARATGIERELKIEREWRASLQESSIGNIERISQLRQEVDQLKMESEKYKQLQEEHYALKEICSEQEHTLEELGAQLSSAKLSVAELREACSFQQAQHQQAQLDGTAAWANDRMVTQCKGCSREFNIARRKVIKLFNYPRPGAARRSDLRLCMCVCVCV
ncbi:unnamed protein product [Trichogramma brassicae]|uniref:RUN domain-containing protein n=1 Tax=Trichogramma brassicae TaxID=86971 RepID=A0A6H5IAF2_9HYME|nr:unnamed protein product [Trichogramma brassicae]